VIVVRVGIMACLTGIAQNVYPIHPLSTLLILGAVFPVVVVSCIEAVVSSAERCITIQHDTSSAWSPQAHFMIIAGLVQLIYPTQ
jgi:hypothetical protein